MILLEITVISAGWRVNVATECDGKKGVSVFKGLQVVHMLATIVLGIFTYELTVSVNSEPEFSVEVLRLQPPAPIGSEEARPFIVFGPDSRDYRVRAEETDGRSDVVRVVNSGRATAQEVFIDISVSEPFSLSLVALYALGSGWLDRADSRIEPSDDPSYRRVKVTITKAMARNERIDMYCQLVYPINQPGASRGQGGITVSVRASSQKVKEPVTRSFGLGL